VSSGKLCSFRCFKLHKFLDVNFDFYSYSSQLNTLAEENFRTILRVPVSGDAAEEVPEDDEEEEEQAPRKAAPRPSKRPRAKASGSEAGASGEASAKKSKTVRPPPLDSRKAERARLKMLSTAGKRSRPIIPGAP
jgi:hypothetical protein